MGDINAASKLGGAAQFILDPAVMKAIGGNQALVSAERYGNSAWASSARLTTRTEADGTLHHYFVKIVRGDLAESRVLGEFTCMSELYKTMPSIAPKPHAAGKCLDTDAYFFLSDYLEIDHRPPNPTVLGERIAELHRRSISPTGQFGFHVVPYDGKLPLSAAWECSWVSFYAKLLEGVYQLDREANGPWEELDRAMEVTLETVIDAVLGPLEQDGRSVKPCLIHGDLWEENIGTDLRTGDVYIFDSCAYYAHHEMAIGMWRVDHHQMKAKEYRNEYFKNFPPDEPVEQYDDRNRLYCVKEKIMYSAHVPGTKARAQALEDLQYLIDRYASAHNSAVSISTVEDLVSVSTGARGAVGA